MFAIRTARIIIRLSGENMRFRGVVKILRADGWREVDCVGSHHQYKHPVKPNKVTVPEHRGDIDPKVLKSILRQAGLR